MVLKIGTRSSKLAIWQASAVKEILDEHGVESEIVEFTSLGDRSLGGNLSSSVGQFIHSIDNELVRESIDIAVHSSKDVPVEIPELIENLAYLKRGTTADLVLTKFRKDIPSLEETLDSEISIDISDILDKFERGSTFGTVSGRRQSFLLSKRPDIIPLSVRGHVQTRIKRLIEGRADAIILAEIGLQRLRSTGLLQEFEGKISACRINEMQWPTAPGQGAICVHCKADRFEELSKIREIINNSQTEKNVNAERNILQKLGGGCLYPAGISVSDGYAEIRISPSNWREIFCQGNQFDTTVFSGPISTLDVKPPSAKNQSKKELANTPRIISTLNSDRISSVLNQSNIPMKNLPVVELIPNFESWPKDFLSSRTSKKDWPYLILTSPFAAKCAIQISKQNHDIERIQWVAIGEGTARACFREGVTVAVCAKARNAEELLNFICSNLSTNTNLLLPRSNLASNDLENGLKEYGFEVKSWIGYENAPKSVENISVNPDDVLLLSSSSSAISWSQNGLDVPEQILCMGIKAKDTIQSLDCFKNSQVSVLKGPTTDYLIQWWKKFRGNGNRD
ncbi:MAG: uroporphyrinogen-III synthase [Candidatus Thermoplasmatota archaeon]|nr:uroporphyrinogen-III synthase [Candidatus Thermoplasmatota archaeon]